MSAPARLTLAIPYYRGRDYLRRTVESVLAQRDGRWQLVVCDGGGDAVGGVGEWLAGYADPRIGYQLPAGPVGIAENWNRCLTAGETDLIALPHADDELLPDYVGRTITTADRHPTAAVLFCESRIIGPTGEARFSFPDYCKRFFRPNRGRIVRLHGDRGLRAVMRADFIMCPTMCFRRSRLGPRRFDPRWRQVLDLELIARLLLAGETLVGVPDVLYAYRRHPGNATAAQTQTLLRFHEERALYDEVAAAAAARGWDRTAAVARRGDIIRLNLGFCTLLDVLRRRWGDAGRKGRLLARLSGQGPPCGSH